MAWNEPGGNGSGNGNDNDPWGNRKNSGGPPDLDEVFKNIKNKLNALFGGRTGGGGNRNSGSGGSSTPGFPGGFDLRIAGVAAGLLALLWLASGFYILQPAERGVVTQFGAYKNTQTSGWHWRLPWPVQAIERVDVKKVRTVRLRDQPVLTQDENIVDIDLAAQYTIKSASDYLFRVRDPDATLQEVLESALREVVGQTNMEPVITTGRAVVDDSTQVALQNILDEYQSGISVTEVLLERAQPPEEVQAAFSDAIKAREDKERFINEAQAYRNEILPQARGEAQQYLEEALSYKSRVENAAEGESARFTSLLREYQKAPAITRDRLYLETMESVLSNTSKVMVGKDNGNSLMYLPIDQLIKQSQREPDNDSNRELPVNSSTGATNLPSQIREAMRDDSRLRSRGN